MDVLTLVLLACTDPADTGGKDASPDTANDTAVDTAADTGHDTASDTGHDTAGDELTLASGPYLLTVGEPLAETCGGGLAGDALREGSRAPVDVSVEGIALAIASPNPEDLTWVGTLEGGELYATQVTSADYTTLGYDCVLEYGWWIAGSVTSDNTAAGSLGLDYTPLSGTECDALAAEGGSVVPCGWSVAYEMVASP